MFSVVTGRFNNETRDANYQYRKKHGYECIYCVPMELSPKIYYNTPVFVIEMNNSTDKIEGIGLIKNNPELKKYYKVHMDGNTNRFTYIGKYFMDRETIFNNNPTLVNVLEEILFKGKTHSKRGCGLSLIPEKVLKLDVCKEMNVKKDIRDLFVYNFREKMNQENGFIEKEEKMITN